MAQLFGIARLGRDAELRYLPNGDAVANLALAFSYGKKDQSGNRPTQWVDGSIFGKRAESLAPYLTKGQQVGVTLDDVHIRTYQKQDGTEGFALSGRVSSLEFAGSAPQQTQQPQQRPAPQQQRQSQQAQQAPGGAWLDDMDQDVPF